MYRDLLQMIAKLRIGLCLPMLEIARFVSVEAIRIMSKDYMLPQAQEQRPNDQKHS